MSDINSAHDMFREAISDKFGMDSREAAVKYSSDNRAYIFPEDYVIRIGKVVGDPQTRMGELYFLRDIYFSGATVCAAVPSLSGNLAERFLAGGKEWAAVKFIKAKGDAVKGANINARHAESVGETLGHIHMVSRDLCKAGVSYRRPTWREAYGYLLSEMDSPAFSSCLDAETRDKLKYVFARVKAFGEDPAVNYGLIHADFNHYNYYVNGDEIWVFDFFDCHYGFYMYDIATLFLLWLTRSDANTDMLSREVKDELLAGFRKGYERYMTLPKREWEKLATFMNFRQAVMILDAVHAKVSGDKVAGNSGIASALPKLLAPFMAADVFEGIDGQMAQSRKTRELVIKALRGEIDMDDPENSQIKALLRSEDMKPFIEALL